MGVGNCGDEMGMGRSMFGVGWGLGLVEGICPTLKEDFTDVEFRRICVCCLHRFRHYNASP